MAPATTPKAAKRARSKSQDPITQYTPSQLAKFLDAARNNPQATAANQVAPTSAPVPPSIPEPHPAGPKVARKRKSLPSSQVSPGKSATRTENTAKDTATKDLKAAKWPKISAKGKGKSKDAAPLPPPLTVEKTSTGPRPSGSTSTAVPAQAVITSTDEAAGEELIRLEERRLKKERKRKAKEEAKLQALEFKKGESSSHDNKKLRKKQKKEEAARAKAELEAKTVPPVKTEEAIKAERKEAKRERKRQKHEAKRIQEEEAKQQLHEAEEKRRIEHEACVAEEARLKTEALAKASQARKDRPSSKKAKTAQKQGADPGITLDDMQKLLREEREATVEQTVAAVMKLQKEKKEKKEKKKRRRSEMALATPAPTISAVPEAVSPPRKKRRQHHDEDELRQTSATADASIASTSTGNSAPHNAPMDVGRKAFEDLCSRLDRDFPGWTLRKKRARDEDEDWDDVSDLVEGEKGSGHNSRQNAAPRIVTRLVSEVDPLYAMRAIFFPPGWYSDPVVHRSPAASTPPLPGQVALPPPTGSTDMRTREATATPTEGSETISASKRPATSDRPGSPEKPPRRKPRVRPGRREKAEQRSKGSTSITNSPANSSPAPEYRAIPSKRASRIEQIVSPATSEGQASEEEEDELLGATQMWGNGDEGENSITSRPAGAPPANGVPSTSSMLADEKGDHDSALIRDQQSSIEVSEPEKDEQNQDAQDRQDVNNDDIRASGDEERDTPETVETIDEAHPEISQKDNAESADARMAPPKLRGSEQFESTRTPDEATFAGQVDESTASFPTTTANQSSSATRPFPDNNSRAVAEQVISPPATPPPSNGTMRGALSRQSTSSSDDDQEALQLSLKAHASPVRKPVDLPIANSSLEQQAVNGSPVAFPSSSRNLRSLSAGKHAPQRARSASADIPERIVSEAAQQQAAEYTPFAFPPSSSLNLRSSSPGKKASQPSASSADVAQAGSKDTDEDPELSQPSSAQKPRLEEVARIGASDSDDDSDDSSSSDSDEESAQVITQRRGGRRSVGAIMKAHLSGSKGKGRQSLPASFKATDRKPNSSLGFVVDDEEVAFEKLLSQGLPKSASQANLVLAQASNDEDKDDEDTDEDDNFSDIEARSVSPEIKRHKARKSQAAGSEEDSGMEDAGILPATQPAESAQISSAHGADAAVATDPSREHNAVALDGLVSPKRSQQPNLTAVASVDSSWAGSPSYVPRLLARLASPTEDSQYVPLHKPSPLFLEASQTQLDSAPAIVDPRVSFVEETVEEEEEDHEERQDQSSAIDSSQLVPPASRSKAVSRALLKAPTPSRVTRASSRLSRSPSADPAPTPAPNPDPAAKPASRTSPTSVEAQVGSQQTPTARPKKFEIKVQRYTSSGKASSMKSLSQLDNEPQPQSTASPRRSTRASQSRSQSQPLSSRQSAGHKGWFGTGADSEDEDN